MSIQPPSEPTGMEGFVSEEAREQFMAERQAFRFTHFTDVNVPASAVAGRSITVTGTVAHDQVSLIGEVRVRVRLESPDVQGQQVIFEMGHGDTEQFSFDIPAPQNAGTQVAFTLYADAELIDIFGFGGWTETDTAGPHRVNIVTAGQKQRDVLFSAAPWIASGTTLGAGVGLSGRTGVSPTAGAVLGTGFGLTGYLIQSEDLVPAIQFPTVPAAITVAGLFGGALLIGQLRESTPSLPTPNPG